MKKISIILLIVATFAACSKKAGNANSEADSTKVDTATTANEAAAIDESQASARFASPDRALYNLLDKVKQVKGSYRESNKNGKTSGGDFLEYTIAFDPDGMLTTDTERYYKKKNDKAKRDKEGRIILLQHDSNDDFAADNTDEFTYKGGLLATSSNEFYGEISAVSSTTYSYDEEGNLVKSVRKGVSDGIKFTYTTTYTIKNKDDKGNWTQRLVYCVEEEITPEYDDENGDVKPGEQTVNSYYRIENRKIQYY